MPLVVTRVPGETRSRTSPIRWKTRMMALSPGGRSRRSIRTSPMRTTICSSVHPPGRAFSVTFPRRENTAGRADEPLDFRERLTHIQLVKAPRTTIVRITQSAGLGETFTSACMRGVWSTESSASKRETWCERGVELALLASHVVAEAGHDVDMEACHVWERAMTRRLGPTLPGKAVLAAVILALSACAQDAGPEPRGGANGADPSAVDLYASCGATRFSPLPPDPSSLPSFTSWNEVDTNGLGGEGPYFEEFVASYDWFVADDSATARVLFGDGGDGKEARRDPPHAFVSLELREAAWTPVGWGQCRMEVLADGWGNARFALDPGAEPAPHDDRIAVLATEMACTGGGPPDGRRVRSVVVGETEETISVVILVEPPTGGQTCPGNPRFRHEIPLDAPLGDRTVLDGSTYPPSPAR